MKRVLVGFDASAGAANALLTGIDIAKQSNGALQALYVEDHRYFSYTPFSVALASAIGVSPRTPQPLPADKMIHALEKVEDERAHVREAFTAIVAPLIEEFAAESQSVRSSQLPELQVELGLPWERLAHAAQSADLLVLGRVGSGSGMRDLAGHETAETVAREIIAPVLLVTERFSRPTRLLLAFDGSEPAQRVMRVLPLLCKGLSVEALTILQVGEDSMPASDSLDAARLYLSQCGVPIEAVVREGQVVETILAVAAEKGANLVAAGAFGAKGMRHLLWGSATEALLGQQELSLLLSR